MHVSSLADVLPAAAASIGAPLRDDLDPLGEFAHVVVLLVDGLGAQNLADAAVLAPRLSGGEVIHTVFPSTTPSGLGAFGTGLPPGVHGLVGASFLDPDTDAVVAPLHWTNTPNPIAFQPHATVFEQLARRGVKVTSIGPAAYAESGLTTAVLRGSTYLAAATPDDRIEHVRAVSASPGLTYVYWAELDRVGHVHGWRSDEWRAALVAVDEFVTQLRAAMPTEAGLVVTADHGMVDVERVVAIDDDAMLNVGVRAVCGEPRARLVYAEEGAADDVQHRWRAALAGHARVYGSAEFAQLYGELDPDIADRLPDLIAVADEGVVLASDRVDRRVSRLIGQHGGTSERETAIPLILC